ncbi:MAG: putative sugar O-methyltransferase [Woeseiaceae bacterium]|jgi:putative sugar O-methyltransferase
MECPHGTVRNGRQTRPVHQLAELITQMTATDSQPDPKAAAFALYPEIEAMFAEFPRYREEILPSRYWEELNHKNLAQLADSRYENFKRTLARNYFTGIINPFNVQMRFLMREAGIWQSTKLIASAIFSPRHKLLKRKHTIFCNLLTNLLWAYVEKNDRNGNLERLSEPLEGNPIQVIRNGRLISQDLANSLIEYETILHPDLDKREVRTILELGPGYGRTAYVFLELQPACRYILVDIPPALYVAQRYLSNVFAERKTFGFRPFSDFEAVRADFDEAEIIFLTPNQLALLPGNSVDLSINISSLHAMRPDQIRYYFAEIERLTRKYFYFKQWQETTIPYDNETIREADYPVGSDWKLLNRQQCKVQAKFFEALYELPLTSTTQNSYTTAT